MSSSPIANGLTVLGSRTIVIATIAITFAMMSVLLQGYYYGAGNNVFHIPIALRLYDDPVFHDDMFIQGLRSFASLFWLAVSQISTEDNIQYVFFALHLASRSLLYMSIAAAALRLGIHTFSQQALLLSVLAVSDVFRGPSLIGKSGLQAEIFTHSEICTPLVIFCLLLIFDRRTTAAFTLAGVVFCINAFIGIWLAPVLSLFLLLREEDAMTQRLIKLTKAGAVMAAVSLPQIFWIASTIVSSADATPFDYVGFLRNFYPHHFFIQAAAASDLVEFFFMLGSASLAVSAMGEQRRNWLIALSGFAVVFAAGVGLPFITSNRLLLNLHLLRSDAILTAIAFLLVASWACREIQKAAEHPEPIVLLIALITGWWPGIFLACLLLWRTTRGAPSRMVSLGIAVTGIVLGLLFHAQGRFDQIIFISALLSVTAAYVHYLRSHVSLALIVLVPATFVAAKQIDRMAAQDGWLTNRRPDWIDWQEVQKWAARETASDAIFLIPIDNKLIGFQIGARRQIWVGYREGTSVMWDPKYFVTWSSRIAEVSRLKDVGAKLDYAASHGIDYIIESGQPKGPAVYQNRGFTVFAVGGKPN